MAERFNAAVLKTAVGKPTVGSNPTLSASFSHVQNRLSPRLSLIHISEPTRH